MMAAVQTVTAENKFVAYPSKIATPVVDTLNDDRTSPICGAGQAK
jgi:hypothetical protein